MTTLRETCAVAVIAKAPRPGHVKTRLQAVLTGEEAAQLGRAFLQDTLANLALAGREVAIASFIAYAPAGQEGRFDGVGEAALLLADGTQGDAAGVEGFGRVLLDTVRALLARGYRAACVLGADSPTLPTASLVRAASALLQGQADAVLGPAEDGGYWLLGLTQPHDAAFAGIAWSTERVADETRARLHGMGLRVVELPVWYDVDDPPALGRLLVDCAGSQPGEAFAASHTVAVVEAIGLVARLGARPG